MTANRIEGVLFDVDDTLVDTRGAFASAMSVLADVYLPHLPREQHANVLATWRRDVGGHYRAYTRGEVDFRTQRMTRANELHAAFGGPVLDDAGFDVWDEVFETAFAAAWHAFDDAPRAVDALLADGVRVGALSNAAVEYQVRKLATVGLGDRVPMLVGVDTLGVGKPAPEVFLESCRRLGTDPAHTLYVGDELDIDATAARRAGLRGVWLDRPGTRRGGVHLEDPAAAAEAGVDVIATLDALPGIVAETRDGVPTL
ncbi:putative hydrolase of the HAD superfamily [Flavimobilis soli]|uniref:Putative hydrolase of the HAD superfamily n=1 Tax=Flavimobilis soli TaxID=442709 RepID=A0A2A9EHP6_9MICO|nr:HAD family hydrolase [Flavimobilis soli]PFG37772.1 putative hydrolase of the HAD superfamily [Flavimobilis soli]